MVGTSDEGCITSHTPQNVRTSDALLSSVTFKHLFAENSGNILADHLEWRTKSSEICQRVYNSLWDRSWVIIRVETGFGERKATMHCWVQSERWSKSTTLWSSDAFVLVSNHFDLALSRDWRSSGTREWGDNKQIFLTLNKVTLQVARRKSQVINNLQGDYMIRRMNMQCI